MSNLEEEVLSPIDETRISEYFSEWYREETAPEEVEDAEEEDVVEEEGGAVEEVVVEEGGGPEFGGLETYTGLDVDSEDFKEASDLLQKISHITDEKIPDILIRAVNREFQIVADDLHTWKKLGKITTEQLDFIEQTFEIRSLYKMFDIDIGEDSGLSSEQKEELVKIRGLIEVQQNSKENDDASSEDE